MIENQTLTLTEFLLARIAEDEAVARNAGPQSWVASAMPPEGHPARSFVRPSVGTTPVETGSAGGWTIDPEGNRRELDPVPMYSSSTVVEVPKSARVSGSGTVEHIARHNPARVLAECEAKRRIVERHRDCGSGYGYCDDGGHGWDDGGCPDLATLAAVYADHPDYREEWRP